MSRQPRRSHRDERERERERQRQRHRDRDRETETDRGRDRQTRREGWRERQRHRGRERQRHREAERERDLKGGRERQRHKGREGRREGVRARAPVECPRKPAQAYMTEISNAEGAFLGKRPMMVQQIVNLPTATKRVYFIVLLLLSERPVKIHRHRKSTS